MASEAFPTSGLCLWLDAAAKDTLEVDAQGAVHRWRCRAGSGRKLEVERPFLESKEPNLIYDVEGLPSIRFGRNQTMRMNVGLTTPRTIVSVHNYCAPQNPNPVANFYIFGCVDPVDNPMVFHGGHWNDGSGMVSSDANLKMIRRGPGFPAEERSSAPAEAVQFWQTPRVAILTFKESVPFPTPNGGNNACRIGVERVYHEFSGEVSELLVYDRPLNDSECQFLEQYLAKKWHVDANPNVQADIAIKLAKLVAGGVRFLTEDAYNAIMQSIYLCKIWKNEEVTWANKGFLLLSILAGLIVSFSGPLMEWCALRGKFSGGFERLNQLEDDTEGNTPLLINMSSRPSVVAALNSEEFGLQQVNDEVELGGPQGKGQDDVPAGPSKQRGAPEDKLWELLIRSDMEHSVAAQRLLLCTALLIWGSHIALYFFLDIGCGRDVPKMGWFVFIFLCIWSLIVQLWVVIHSQKGYLLFRYCNENQFLFSVCFSLLGLFDTFSDVVNALSIQSCASANPELFSFFTIHEYRFQLPTNLGNLVQLGLVFILVFQALPGIYLLARKQWLMVALKFNEFGIVLLALTSEAH